MSDFLLLALSYLPAYFRPAAFLALAVVVLWLLVGRKWILWALFALAIALAWILALVAQTILKVECLHTLRRLQHRRRPSSFLASLGSLSSAVLGGLRSVLQSLRPASTRLSVKPLLLGLGVCGLIGISVAAVGAAVPGSAVSGSYLSRVFEHWARLERAAGVPPARIANTSPLPPPTIDTNRSEILISYPPEYATQPFEIRGEPTSDGEGAKLAAGTLDAKGTAKIKQTKNTVSWSKKGRTVVLEAGGLAVRIRVT